MNPDWYTGLYCGPIPYPTDLWSRWNFDPVLVLALAGLSFWLRPSLCRMAAVMVLMVIFVSPLCALAAALFSARVVHHVLLVAVAAPLIAAAWPARRARFAVPSFVAATVTLWIWHLPAAYDLALSNVVIYWLMQITLLASAVAVWRRVLHPEQEPGVALLLTFGSFIQMALLGALLTLAPQQLYAIHAVAPLSWGLTPLEDQQLGGLIMWIPAAVPFLIIGGWIALRAWRAMGDVS